METIKEMKFKTLPTTVDAIQLTEDNWDECIAFVGEENLADGTSKDEEYIEIHTFDATTDCRLYEWIVKHPNGNFSTWKDDAFHEHFTPSESTTLLDLPDRTHFEFDGRLFRKEFGIHCYCVTDREYCHINPRCAVTPRFDIPDTAVTNQSFVQEPNDP